ncbi:hypothetical protein GINT2_000426 [Glugoides intestinalis]
MTSQTSILYSRIRRAMLLFIVSAVCTTLIVPLTQLNHRLTLHDTPKIINSALKGSNISIDYFNFPAVVTYITSSDKSICYRNGQFYTCPKSTKAKVWKLEDVEREVRFRDSHGNCLTLGKYNSQDDSFDVDLLECLYSNKKQIFILFKDPIANGKIARINGHNMKTTYGRLLSAYGEKFSSKSKIKV